jgi:large repetitive protein
VTVNYATADSTAKAPGDYTAKSSALSLLAGQTTETLTVAVRGDLSDEPNETFFVNLSGAVNAAIGDNQGQVSVVNDD